MPEIWLKYGTTDVALDIKFGNLLAQVSPDIPLMSDEDIAATLGNVAMSNNMLILPLSKSKPVQRIVQMLQAVIQSRGFEGVHVNAVRKLPLMEGNEGFNVGSHDCPLVLGRRYRKCHFCFSNLLRSTFWIQRHSDNTSAILYAGPHAGGFRIETEQSTYPGG